MKKWGLCVLFLATAIFYATCEDGLVTTGEKDVIVISNMQFTLTSKTFTSSKLTAVGTIKNISTKTTVYPTWYVEGDFYADSTFALKLGGDHYEMPFTLAPGEMATWQLEFISSLYIESDYPHFGIKNFRAFKYEED